MLIATGDAAATEAMAALSRTMLIWALAGGFGSLIIWFFLIMFAVRVGIRPVLEQNKMLIAALSARGPAKWRVAGIDKETGAETSVVITADSEDEAKRKGLGMGIRANMVARA